MIRRLTLVLVVVLVAIGSAAAAGAQQYPPNGNGPDTSVLGAGVDRNPASGANGANGANGSGTGNDGSGAPLVRTGSDVGRLALVGMALVAAGGFWVLSARRVRSSRPVAR